ncbi:MAG: hypothetical protein GTN36_05000 [Candidatus Aenigmarchaeota archaeon]|nr:hypothetical protein [Candidatus Aenigmarchaeota archaeon]
MDRRSFDSKLSREFWFGLLIGILGGAIGDIFIELWYRTPDDPQTFLLPTIIATIMFVGLCLFLIHKIGKRD